MKTPFIALCLFLVLGILCVEYSAWLAACLCVLLPSLFYKRLSLINFGIIVFVFLCGVFFHALPNATQRYETNKEAAAVVKILSKENSAKKYYKYFGEIGGQKVLLSTPKDLEPLKVGNSYRVKGEFKEIYRSSNPYSFDYHKFLRRKGIQQNLKITSFKLKAENKNPIYKLRHSILERITQSPLNESSRLFIKTMFLGEKDVLTREDRNNFQKAGVVHILAISGLHVLILFRLVLGAFGFALKPFRKRNLPIVLALLTVWFYAAFVGFRPSVLRASLMLSLYYASQMLSRQSYAPHAVFGSAFLLLLYDTNYLFDLGFQLSYAAVMGLIYGFKVLGNKIRTKHRVANYFLGLTTASVLAQLSTAPIILYHFGFFSSWFIIGNLVMIPAAGLLIILSLTISLIAAFLQIPLGVGHFMNFICNSLHAFIQLLASQDFGILEHLRFNCIHLILAYLSLGLVYNLIKRVNPMRVALLSLFLVVFAVEGLYFNYSKIQEKSVIVFDSFYTHVGIRNQSRLILFYDKKPNSYFENVYLPKFLAHEGIRDYEAKPIKNGVKIELEQYEIALKRNKIQIKNSPKSSIDLTFRGARNYKKIPIN